MDKQDKPAKRAELGNTYWKKSQGSVLLHTIFWDHCATVYSYYNHGEANKTDRVFQSFEGTTHTS